MTRTSLVTFFVLALAAPAIAQPAGGSAAELPPPVARMTPPAAWQVDAARAEGIVKQLAAEPHFGGVPVGLDAQYLRSPMPGGLLISTQIVSEAMPADPDAAATAELHAARDGADAVDGAQVTRWEVKLDPGGRVHQALLEWTDPSVGTTVLSRTLVFRTSKLVARVSSECILGPEAGGLRPDCERALASLSAHDADLQPLKVAAERPGAAVAAADDAPIAAAPDPRATPATIGERDAALPSTIMVREPEKQTDKRPLYVLGGLILLGLVFWWNRKTRRELEEQEARADREEGRKVRAASKIEEDQDDDAEKTDEERRS